DLQPFDQVHVNDLNPASPLLPIGTAFTNRTFRFLAEPRYPAGVDGSVPGAFSILRENWIDPKTALNKGAPTAFTNMDTVLGYDVFNPGTNFHDPNNLDNQNGIVFFPGSSPLYASQTLVGGFGVSGDGVDQDDVVTFFGAQGFAAPNNIRADQYFVRGTRLPYQKFSRNPFAI
ncbi:MAG TPA: heme-binding protein, partial [Pirellulales bacterium]